MHIFIKFESSNEHRTPSKKTVFFSNYEKLLSQNKKQEIPPKFV